MKKTNLYVPALLVLVFTFFTACVRDTDFDQAEDITLTPVVELDLIYFNLEANDFFDSSTSNPRLTVTDTTELPFLDDGFVQDDLRKADFLFKFTNSIPRNFDVNFQFLNPENVETYSTQTSIAPGSTNNPQPTDFTETVEGQELIDLTQASKVVVSVTIESSNENLEGELNLKSKTTYHLEL
ncbi:hypothetical protein INR76_07120 [Marixanthomonas sp. SCSIO 43207]|uniref:hypothetical protein n=1 Tax=Marixanthomonas sp. SCSIO 43207 TaxID=2779360 RepID=UPI001CA9764B|nr:hypothetical protein [Marixanthomonas sp. SCSIO 43207]UAB79910.1 hypothetical protein INR76_07120 [Marixanthomonas sp. SCSIO 43207]